MGIRQKRNCGNSLVESIRRPALRRYDRQGWNGGDRGGDPSAWPVLNKAAAGHKSADRDYHACWPVPEALETDVGAYSETIVQHSKLLW